MKQSFKSGCSCYVLFNINFSVVVCALNYLNITYPNETSRNTDMIWVVECNWTDMSGLFFSGTVSSASVRITSSLITQSVGKGRELLIVHVESKFTLWVCVCVCLKEIIADIFHRFHKPLPEVIILLHFSFALQKTEVCNGIFRSFLISRSFCSFSC